MAVSGLRNSCDTDSRNLRWVLADSQCLGEHVQRLGQLGHLRGPAGGDAHFPVAAGRRVRHASRLAQRAGQQPGEQRSGDGGAGQSDQQRDEQASLQGGGDPPGLRLWAARGPPRRRGDGVGRASTK
jgi:hypothetical protein